MLFRRSVIKSLSKTQMIQLPGGSTTCQDDDEYLPDAEMRAIIGKKTGCIPKWSDSKINGLEYCKTEHDFKRYFAANIESHDQISSLPTKCKYNKWTASHYEEMLEDDTNATTIQIMLTSVNNKVWQMIHSEWN